MENVESICSTRPWQRTIINVITGIPKNAVIIMLYYVNITDYVINISMISHLQ